MREGRRQQGSGQTTPLCNGTAGGQGKEEEGEHVPREVWALEVSPQEAHLWEWGVCCPSHLGIPNPAACFSIPVPVLARLQLPWPAPGFLGSSLLSLSPGVWPLVPQSGIQASFICKEGVV